MSKEHEYDGIKEYDNPLPKWWLLTFYATIFFAFGYWGYYHVLHLGWMPTQALAYENQMAEKKLNAVASTITEEDLVKMSKKPEVVQQGKAIFVQNCMACHGDKGQGGIGPNLTDSSWIHGGNAMDIRHTISKGVLEKGMTAWQSVLGDTKINEVVAFILSIRDTNVPGKPPQGTPYEPVNKQ
ncbi:MAG: cbb3-type cytochrome c oxidase N-terminal domain-containing protein [Myxococcaceae bacterium]